MFGRRLEHMQLSTTNLEMIATLGDVAAAATIHCTNADACGNTFSFINPAYAASHIPLPDEPRMGDGID